MAGGMRTSTIMDICSHRLQDMYLSPRHETNKLNITYLHRAKTNSHKFELKSEFSKTPFILGLIKCICLHISYILMMLRFVK